jgi:hypothetical protein
MKKLIFIVTLLISMNLCAQDSSRSVTLHLNPKDAKYLLWFLQIGVQHMKEYPLPYNEVDSAIAVEMKLDQYIQTRFQIWAKQDSINARR